MKQKFDVTGMTCSACSAHVEKSVRKLPGVSSVAVNLLQNTMMVEYDGDALSDAQICDAVKASGYGASPQQPHGAGAKRAAAPKEAPGGAMAAELAGMKRRLIVSFCFLVPLMYVSMGHMMGLPLPHILHGAMKRAFVCVTQFLLTLPIIYVNRKYYQAVTRRCCAARQIWIR